jgi:hypothetical protein
MSDFEEYEFVLPDASTRYEMVDLSMPVGAQMFAFKRLHGAIAAWPLRLVPRFADHRAKLIRRLAEAAVTP